MFERHLGIVVGSHLNDAMIEISINPKLAKQRMKFVKALTFFNEDILNYTSFFKLFLKVFHCKSMSYVTGFWAKNNPLKINEL